MNPESYQPQPNEVPELSKKNKKDSLELTKPEEDLPKDERESRPEKRRAISRLKMMRLLTGFVLGSFAFGIEHQAQAEESSELPSSAEVERTEGRIVVSHQKELEQFRGASLETWERIDPETGKVTFRREVNEALTEKYREEIERLASSSRVLSRLADKGYTVHLAVADKLVGSLETIIHPDRQYAEILIGRELLEEDVGKHFEVSGATKEDIFAVLFDHEGAHAYFGLRGIRPEKRAYHGPAGAVDEHALVYAVHAETADRLGVRNLEPFLQQLPAEGWPEELTQRWLESDARTPAKDILSAEDYRAILRGVLTQEDYQFFNSSTR